MTSSPSSAFFGKANSPAVLLACLLAVHVWMTVRFLSPEIVFSPEPILTVDYPVHAHRVFVYREALFESLVPWGYDPSISAGFVMPPGRDVGAKPQQVLGVLLWFVGPTGVVKLFLILTLLLLPMSPYFAARSMGLSQRHAFWIAAAMAALLWLHPTVLYYFKWGLVAFLAACSLAPWVLAGFVRFVEEPSWRRYGSLVVWSSLLQLLHGEGPWIIAPAAALLILVSRACRLPWKVAGLLTPLPVALANAFWLVPFFLARSMPWPPQLPLPDTKATSHLTYHSLAEVVGILEPAWVASRVVMLVGALLAYWLLFKRLSRVAWIGLLSATVSCLILKYFGSFLPLVGNYQTVRFIVPAIIFISFPLGTLLDRADELATARGIRGSLLALIAMALVLWFRGPAVEFGKSGQFEALEQFVTTQTTEMDRLAIQSADGFENHGYEARALGLTLRREVMGSTFPATDESAQFLRHFFLGRRIADWEPEELEIALERWGISWVLTRTEEAAALLEEATAGKAISVHPYQAFATGVAPSRFLKGSGSVRVGINRLELRDLEPENGIVVLRYRYHPAWQTSSSAEIVQYPVAEDPVGFLALEDPPETLVLEFEPWKMLFEPWPDRAGEG